jgi:hypothetical protein
VARLAAAEGCREACRASLTCRRPLTNSVRSLVVFSVCAACQPHQAQDLSALSIARSHHELPSWAQMHPAVSLVGFKKAALPLSIVYRVYRVLKGDEFSAQIGAQHNVSLTPFHSNTLWQLAPCLGTASNPPNMP